ncbi:MAG TPA: DUF2911 domain-containing protein [Roseivirga sp.]
MKKVFISFATLLLLVSFHSAQAQRGPAPSPKVTITQMIGNTTLTMVYSRPSLDGRSLATLAPKGQIWRTGANENTRLTFDKDVMLGGKKLAAGQYSLYSIPGDGEWTIVINKAMSWGTAYDESQDVFRFTAKATETDKTVETFSMMMTDFDKNSKDKAMIELAWGNTSVKFPITVTN